LIDEFEVAAAANAIHWQKLLLVYGDRLFFDLVTPTRTEAC